MPLLDTDLIPLALLAPLLLCVGYSDLRYMRIPNLLSLIALALFVLTVPLIGWEEAGWRLLAAIVVFALFFIAFVFRLFGGGDVKMMGVLALFIPSQTLSLYAYSFSFSMLLGIALILLVRVFPFARESSWIGVNSIGKFPMGISIAMSGLVHPLVLAFAA